jgi:hypothetical protein
MQKRILLGSILSLFCTSLVYAETTEVTYTNVSPFDSGFHHQHHHQRESFAITTTIPNPETTYIVTTANHHHRSALTWVDMVEGDALPDNAVVGGSQPQPYATLFICRALYDGGYHPGKLYDGACNIGWGGSEIRVNRYQVLVSA